MKRILLAAIVIVMVAGCESRDCSICADWLDVGECVCKEEGDTVMALGINETCIQAAGKVISTDLDNYKNIIRHCSPDVLAEVRGYMERGEEYEVEIGEEKCELDCSVPNTWICLNVCAHKCTVTYTGPITPAMKTKLKELTDEKDMVR